MPEYRIHVTLAEHGHDPENGVAFLEGFMKMHPEVGPSVSQNTEDGTLSVTFSLDAEDTNEAFELARPIFASGAAASELEFRPVVNLEISLVPEHEIVEEPEPALA